MRPCGETAVASMVSTAAPDEASWPKCMRCQSVIRPCSAEYWHIGATTMRLASRSWPTFNGVKRVASLIRVPADGAKG